MSRVGEVRVESRLGLPARAVWERVSTFEGVNDELRPLMRMTAPRDASSLDLDEVVLGRRLFRSWVLLLGIVPFDYDDLTLVRVEPGRGFLERSPMLSQRLWEHERTIRPEGERACIIADRVRFEPRRALPVSAVRPLVLAVFRHRHRRLRHRFGGAALPVDG